MHKAFFKDSGLSDAEQTLICSSLGVKDIKDFAYVEEADINAIDLRPVPKNKLRRALQQWADSQKPPAEEPELNGDSVVLPVESKPPALFPRGKTYDDELLASKQREEREAKKSRKKSEVSLTDDSYTESVPATPSVRGAAISGGSAAERRLSAGTEKTAVTAVTAVAVPWAGFFPVRLGASLVFLRAGLAAPIPPITHNTILVARVDATILCLYKGSTLLPKLVRRCQYFLRALALARATSCAALAPRLPSTHLAINGQRVACRKIAVLSLL